MFLSLSKYSPKSLLASYLSASIARFFDVDPDRVETNLVRDARVVLKGVEMRPRLLGVSRDGSRRLRAGGRIERIEFSWAWDGSALIKDARLSASGVFVNVNVVDGDSTGDDDAAWEGEGKAGSDDDKGTADVEAPPDWKARYMQQIVDNLTLAVTDVTVAVHLDEVTRMILQAEDIELATVASHGGGDKGSAPKLLQSISLSSIKSWIEDDGAGGSAEKKFPVLEPFGYRASVTRISGRRFLDGVLSGLLVEGGADDGPLSPSTQAPSCIRIRAGVRQVAGLNSLRQVLLLASQGDGEDEADADGAGIPSQDVGEKDDGTQASLEGRAWTRSIFRLPFRYVEVTLENDARMRMEGCSVGYCTDGSDLSLDCSGGIWVDDEPLSREGRWVLDFVSSNLSLEPLPSGEDYEGDTFFSAQSDGDPSDAGAGRSKDALPRLDLSLDAFGRVYRGMMAVAPRREEAEAPSEWNAGHRADAPPDSSAPWSAGSSGPVALRFTGEGGHDWVEAVVGSPRFGSKGGSISFECASADVSSSAGFATRVPRVFTDDDGRIVVERHISATADSMDAFKVLRTMWGQVSDVLGDGPSGADRPFDVQLAGIDARLREPHSSALHLTRIGVSGDGCSIGTLKVRGVGGMTSEATSLHITLGSKETSVLVRKIDKLSYDGVDYLAAPTDGATLSFRDGDTLSAAFKDVTLRVPARATSIEDNVDGVEVPSLDIPVSIHFRADRLRVDSSTGDNVHIEGASFWLRPTAGMVAADLDLKSIKARVGDELELSCGKISGSANVVNSIIEKAEGVVLPGLGRLSSASMTIQDVTHLSSAVGQLSEPLDIVEISCDDRSAKVKCDRVVCHPNAGDAATRVDENHSTSLTIPIALCLEANRLILYKRAGSGPGMPGISCRGVRARLAPGEAAAGIIASFDRVQGRGADRSGFDVNGVEINLVKDLREGKNRMLGLKEASLSMKKVSAASFPSGGLKLADPITNAIIQLKDKTMDVKCDSIHVSHIQSNAHADSGDNDAAFADLLVDFNIGVSRVTVDSSSATVTCNRVSVQCKKEANAPSKFLQLGMASLNCRAGEDSYEADGIAVTTKWQNEVEHGKHLTLPYLGALSFAKVESEACTKMNTSAFSLIRPINKPELLFQDGSLLLKLSEVQLDATKAISGSGQHTEKQNKKMNLEFMRVPIGFQVSGMLRLKATFFDVQFHNVGMYYTRSTPSPAGEVFVRCNKVCEEGSLTVNNVELDLSLSLNGEAKVGAGPMGALVPGIDYIERASIKIAEVASFSGNNLGRLSSPMQNTSIYYQNGVLAADIKSVQFESLFGNQSLGLDLKGVNAKIQSDPVNQTLCAKIQGEAASSHGHVSFGAAGISLSAVIVPAAANAKASASRPLVIPLLGHISSMLLDVSKVPFLSIENVGFLKMPMTKVTVHFENDVITCRCPTVFMQRSMPKKVVLASDNGGYQLFEFPFKTRMSIETFQIYEPSGNSTDHLDVTCKELKFALSPVKSQTGQMKEPILKVQAKGNEINIIKGSTNITTRCLSITGLLLLDDLSTVKNLAVGIKTAQITAKFSSSDWSGSQPKEQLAETRLPFAAIPKFKLTLKYVGDLVKLNDATIACDEFQGDGNTTLSQLQSHYLGVVKGRLPYLLAKTDIGGSNVVDSFGTIAGTALMARNKKDGKGSLTRQVTSSGVGAAIGVASIDMVSSAVAQGKESRGVDASERYQFGDFTRGVVSSVRHAAKTGAGMRGDDSYQFGDFSLGAAKAVGDYTAKNSCRLAGAAGTSMGMTAGAALLGPVGLVAGSAIGGSIAKTSVGALNNNLESDAQPLDKSQKPAKESLNDKKKHPSLKQVPDTFWPDNHFVAQSEPNQQSVGRTSASSTRQIRQRADFSQYPANQSHTQSNIHTTPKQQATSQNQEGYRFGDITKGIVTRGKRADGRDENSGYKFGDFTRGMFG